jgi:hypothetical protein
MAQNSIGTGLKIPEYQGTTPEIQQTEGQLREVQPALERTLAPTQESRTQIETEIKSEAAQPLPAPPKLLPIPEYHARTVSPQETQAFMGISVALAALASLNTRQPLINTMNTAAAAMDGFHKGDVEMAKRELETFRAQADTVYKTNAQMLQEYNAVLQNRQYSMQIKTQMLQVIANRERDEIALAQLKSGNLRSFLDLQQKRLDGMNQWNLGVSRFIEAANQHGIQNELLRLRLNAMTGGGGATGLSPDAVDMLAREAIKDKGVLSNIGRGVQGARDLRAITNRMAEIMAVEGGPGMAQRRQEFRADSNSLNKLTMQYDAITAFEHNAVRNGRQLVDLAYKVDVTGLPVMERWVRAGRQAIAGDPDVSAFNAQMQVFRTEAARILTNPNLTGQLTDSARHEVEAFLSGNDSAKQIDVVESLLERDFTNRKHTLEAQMDAVRDRMTRGYAAGTQPGAAGAPAPIRSKSKSGRDIISNDGGKTWEYVQ